MRLPRSRVVLLAPDPAFSAVDAVAAAGIAGLEVDASARAGASTMAAAATMSDPARVLVFRMALVLLCGPGSVPVGSRCCALLTREPAALLPPSRVIACDACLSCLLPTRARS